MLVVCTSRRDGSVKRLSGSDAYMLYGENPNLPVHTLKIVVIDVAAQGHALDFQRFRQIVGRRLADLDPLRYRLVDIPFRLHHPVWLPNCDVDLDHHLRRVAVAQPGGRREFDDLVARIAEAPLDLRRPLWEMHFAEGLADGKVAVIAKVHHALADGVASANLLARALDTPPHTTENSQRQDVAQCTPPSAVELVRAAGRDHLGQILELPRVVMDTLRGWLRVRRRSWRRTRDAEFARPFQAPRSFINHKLGRGRRFATATLSVAEVKETSKAFGVSLNDVVLAMSAGALRELSVRHDGKADQPMIATMPVSTDASPERISGNALGALMVSLPIQIDDAARRTQLVSMATARAKENNVLRGPDLMGRWFEYMPPLLAPAAFRWLSRRQAHNSMYNVSISNVRGPRERGSIGGAPISEFYSVGPPTPACGMNITVWSYADQLNLCVLTDDRTCDDAHEVTSSLSEAFAELRHAAGLTAPVDVATAMAPAS
jgi:diacylglycerol O-acyltransferase / wax synthase